MSKCIICEKDISNKRSDAITCSANCRKQLSRQKAKIERMTAKIKSDIMALQRLAIDDGTEKSVTAAMVTLKQYLEPDYVMFEQEQKQQSERDAIRDFLESRKQAIRDARRSHV